MVKLSDVAIRCGVGAGTVSRVLNNSGPVSQKTREKILEVIQEMNYVPNETARMFKNQDPKIVAIIIPTNFHPFYGEFAYYIEQELSKNGYKSMICNSGNLPEKEKSFFEMIRQNKISGAICISYNYVDEEIYKSKHIIFLDRIFESDIPYVASDNYNGGIIACEYFHKIGINNVAYIGTTHSKINTACALRLVGFQECAKRLSMNFYKYTENHPIENYEDLIDKMLMDHKQFQGVFCEGDINLLLVKKKAKEKGLIVPKDLSLIGYDGISICDGLDLNLTTIAQPIESMSKKCVELLLKRFNNEYVPKSNILDVQLQIGDTTI